MSVSENGIQSAMQRLTAAQAEIARLVAEVARLTNAVKFREDMHECAMAERDDCIKDWSEAKSEIARLTAERDAAMAGRVKVKPLWWCYPCRSVGMMHCNDPEHCGCMTTADAEADSWKSWLDDLPLPDDFRPGVDRLQDFITRILATLQPGTEQAEPVPTPQARQITVQEAAQVPEVKALVEAAKSAADALDMAYGDPHDEETQHRYSSNIRAAIAAMQKGG